MTLFMQTIHLDFQALLRHQLLDGKITAGWRMKERIPDGNEYNPQSSRKLAQWCPDEYGGGFRHEAETLYMTQAGNYFILLEGGLFSRFHEYPGSGQWYGGTFIHRVSRQEAVIWCEETGNYDALETYFRSARAHLPDPGQA